MARRRTPDNLIRRHVSFPHEADTLFIEYAVAHHMSLSSFLTKAALQAIRKHRGDWAKRVEAIEDPDREVITKEEFRSMTREEKERLWDSWK